MQMNSQIDLPANPNFQNLLLNLSYGQTVYGFCLLSIIRPIEKAFPEGNAFSNLSARQILTSYHGHGRVRQEQVFLLLEYR